MTDNIYLINKECYDLRKQIADIDKIIKEQHDKKDILLEKYNNLITRKNHAKKSKNEKNKKKERTVIRTHHKIDKNKKY